MSTFLWKPGAFAPFVSFPYMPLDTVYGGLLSESLNHV